MGIYGNLPIVRVYLSFFKYFVNYEDKDTYDDELGSFGDLLSECTIILEKIELLFGPLFVPKIDNFDDIEWNTCEIQMCNVFMITNCLERLLNSHVHIYITKIPQILTDASRKILSKTNNTLIDIVIEDALRNERQMVLFMFWVVVSLLHELSHVKMFTYGKNGDLMKKTPPKNTGRFDESKHWLEEEIFGTTIFLDTDSLHKVCLYFDKDKKHQILAQSCSQFFNDTIWNAKEQSIQDFHIKEVPSLDEVKRWQDFDLEKKLEWEAHVPKLTTDDPRHWDDQTTIVDEYGKVVRVRY